MAVENTFRFLILSLIVTILYFFGFSKDIYSTAIKARNKFRKLENKKTEMLTEIKLFDTYLLTYEKIKNKNRDFMDNINKSGEATAISKKIDEWSKVFNIKIRSISFQQPYIDKKIYNIPINVEIEGSFFRIGDFLMAIENRFLNVEIKLENINIKKYPVLIAKFRLYIKGLNQ